MQHVIIKHTSGSTAEQVEEFPLDHLKVLTLGRGTDQAIRYDPNKDDLVSREHARISREEGQENTFVITDLNSRNGTYVNKHRISSTASLLPGDMIQLGPGGPEFQFNLDPVPDGMTRVTREVNGVLETRESAVHSALSSSPIVKNSSPKTSVGRTTVERMLGQYQQNSRKTLVNLAALLAGMLLMVAGVLVY
jgi:serine protease Do